MNQLFPPTIYPTIPMPQAYSPTAVQLPQQGQQLIKVNGLDSAKAYQTQPNSQVALFDANEDTMYIKTTDASNFPTIRIFKFSEVTETEIKDERYVTMDEFNKFKEELLNGKQSIRSEQTTEYRKSKWAGSKGSVRKKFNGDDEGDFESSRYAASDGEEEPKY